MASTITKRCPHCGAVYARDDYAFHPSKGNRMQYGSPVRQCRGCGEWFKDDDYREIAIDGIRSVDKMPISPAGIVYGLLALFMGIGILWNTGSAIGAIVLIGGLITPIMDIATYKNRQEDLKKEEAASKERLSNSDYAIALDKLGYLVPQEYLPEAYLEEKRKSL